MLPAWVMEPGQRPPRPRASRPVGPASAGSLEAHPHGPHPAAPSQVAFQGTTADWDGGLERALPPTYVLFYHEGFALANWGVRA